VPTTSTAMARTLLARSPAWTTEMELSVLLLERLSTRSGFLAIVEAVRGAMS
jgi:hypothetical protein